jgi:glycosyltransferase involved in cell wall biosynthesis
MELCKITPLILTFNEAPNISATLKCLTWANPVVVVDSFSSDETAKIAGRFHNVRIVKRQFDNHTAQWNYGLSCVETDWVLALDADYICPPELTDEIQGLSDDCDAYLASFQYCINGRPLRGTLYPPRAVLFRPQRCHYMQDGHTQLLVHESARSRALRTKLLHDDRKPITRWLSSQANYARLEAEKLCTTCTTQLEWKDRLRHWFVLSPVLTFFYCLFFKRLLLDGRAGLYYTLQRVYAELLVSLMLLDRRLYPDIKLGDNGVLDRSLNSSDLRNETGHELSHTRN